MTFVCLWWHKNLLIFCWIQVERTGRKKKSVAFQLPMENKQMLALEFLSWLMVTTKVNSKLLLENFGHFVYLDFFCLLLVKIIVHVVLFFISTYRQGEPTCRTAVQGHPEILRQITDNLRMTMVRQFRGWGWWIMEERSEWSNRGVWNGRKHIAI